MKSNTIADLLEDHEEEERLEEDFFEEIAGLLEDLSTASWFNGSMVAGPPDLRARVNKATRALEKLHWRG